MTGGPAGGRTVGRRAFVRASVLGLLPAAAQDTTVARLPQPSLAGRPRRPVTDYENDPFIVGLERRLKCTCGCNLDVYTCRTTDFTCAVSPAMHREVIGLYEQGRSGDEIIADFVARHGETILMAPPKEGFNWAGYLVPGVLITLVGGTIAAVLMRRHRVADAAAASSASSASPWAEEAGPPSGLSAADAARLEAELQRLEL